MTAPRFTGSITALITPFKEGAVDERAFQSLVAWQIEHGIDGLVPCGTTGESPTLSHEEHRRVVELCVEVARGKVPVIAGTGSNATDEAIALTRHAKECGADAALIVAPYYNKPSQAGLYAHFKAIHDAVELPIILYNIPGRCVIDMSLETVARLAELPNIIGIKDATGDVARPLRQRALTGPDFIQLSGDDILTSAVIAQGGHGCISVSANVAPKLCAAHVAAERAGDHAKAAALRDKLQPLHDVMFLEPNPTCAKYAASLMGLCTADMRLPLIPASEAVRPRIAAAMRGLGLI
jgi:4-hydroxy-tetrahydrodipicolinate synthase